MDVIRMNSIVNIVFRKSKSKLYSRAVAIAERFTIFENFKDVTSCSIESIMEYIKLQDAVQELISIIEKWKDSKIILCGREYKGDSDLYIFYDQIKSKAGKYAEMIRDSNDKVSLAAITYEDLPLPIVFYPNLYGAFFAFAEDIGKDFYFCECE